MCNGEYTYVNTLLCTDVRKEICEIYDELIQQINGKKSGKVTSWKIRKLESGPDIAIFHSFSKQSTSTLKTQQWTSLRRTGSTMTGTTSTQPPPTWWGLHPGGLRTKCSKCSCILSSPRMVFQKTGLQHPTRGVSRVLAGRPAGRTDASAPLSAGAASPPPPFGMGGGESAAPEFTS